MALALFFLTVGFTLFETGVLLSRYRANNEQWVAGAVTAVMGVAFTLGSFVVAIVTVLTRS